MPTDLETLEQLAGKWLDGSITVEECKRFNKWFSAQPQQPMLIPEVNALSEEHHKEKIWQLVQARIHKKAALRRRKMINLSVAAAVVLTLSLGLCYYLFNGFANNTHITTAGTDLRPGANKAYLTLGNGKELALNDLKVGGQLDDGNVRITKTADGRIVYRPLNRSVKHSPTINTIRAPRGGQYQLILADGTKVWLNSVSTLKYPSTFVGAKKREVELTGEAYFEVAKDAAHPFIVYTKTQRAEVLGTHFNIKSYNDEPGVTTSLMEGKLRVNKAILILGQESVLRDTELVISGFNAHKAIAWKNNQFVFENDNIQNIMRVLQRWYDIEAVVYENGIPKSRFGGTIRKNETLSEILKYLELAGNLKFKIEDKKVWITQ